MADIPKKCPSCQSGLVVTQLSCPHCGTQVQGRFEPDIFSRLSANDYDFIVLFLKTKGNIKEMERELGISYWTIRSKLNDLVAELGLESNPADEVISARRQSILEQLNEGAISVKEAARLLEALKNKR
jgi:hypothetical protein